MIQHISMVRARTQTFDIALTDADGADYVLQTDDKLIFGIKKNYDDASYLLKKVLTSENATDTTGVYALTLAPDDTANMPCDDYCYDISLQSGDDCYSVIDCSHFKLLRNVTKMEAEET